MLLLLRGGMASAGLEHITRYIIWMVRDYRKWVNLSTKYLRRTFNCVCGCNLAAPTPVTTTTSTTTTSSSNYVPHSLLKYVDSRLAFEWAYSCTCTERATAKYSCTAATTMLYPPHLILPEVVTPQQQLRTTTVTAPTTCRAFTHNQRIRAYKTAKYDDHSMIKITED